ncbi:MAG: glycosyltransferase family 39 protein [Betaproteobacteria bacterium]|nr:glycosyltransferase family 39 protein [Betaproteobacteria bacterium]
MLDSSTVRTRVVATLVFVFCIVWFGNLDYRSLVRPDEGRYAEIAREMAVTGDWTTPRLNGIKYFEKPPLQYWMTAAAYKAFGEHEWTARLWAALTGFAGVLMVGFAGASLFGRRTGYYSAMVLASSVLYAVVGHINTLDMGVTFCMTLGLLGFLLAQRGDARTRETRLWMLLAWAAMGFGFLSKGLIGLALPAAAMVAYALVHRDIAFLKRLEPVPGIAIMLAIAMPWIIAVSIANPEFAHFFFIHEHFQRFLTQIHHRTAPWWYFVPILIAGMLPWTTMLGQALIAAWKGDPGGQSFKPRRFLLLYAAVIFLFFSASQSKLPSYILPIFPALALLVGEWLARIRGRSLTWLILPIAILALTGAIASPFVENYPSENVPAALYAMFGRWILAGTLTLLAASCLAMFFAWRERIEAAVIALAAGGVLIIQLIMTGHETLSPSYSTSHLAGTIRPLLDADTPFYSVRTYEQTLPFYIKRTVTLVDYGDELDFGLKQEPELEIPTIEEFEARWRNDRKALAIMGPDIYRELTGRGLPMRLLAEDARRVIVSKP